MSLPSLAFGKLSRRLSVVGSYLSSLKDQEQTGRSRKTRRRRVFSVTESLGLFQSVGACPCWRDDETLFLVRSPPSSQGLP